MRTDFFHLNEDALLLQAHKMLVEAERRGSIPDDLIGHLRLSIKRVAFVGYNLAAQRESEEDRLRSAYDGLTYEDFKP